MSTAFLGQERSNNAEAGNHHGLRQWILEAWVCRQCPGELRRLLCLCTPWRTSTSGSCNPRSRTCLQPSFIIPTVLSHSGGSRPPRGLEDLGFCAGKFVFRMRPWCDLLDVGAWRIMAPLLMYLRGWSIESLKQSLARMAQSPGLTPGLHIYAMRIGKQCSLADDVT